MVKLAENGGKLPSELKHYSSTRARPPAARTGGPADAGTASFLSPRDADTPLLF